MDREIPLSEDMRKRVILYKNCFASEAGMEVLKDLKSYCMYDSTTVVKREGQHIDPLEVLFLDGRLDVAKYIIRHIDMDLPTG